MTSEVSRSGRPSECMGWLSAIPPLHNSDLLRRGLDLAVEVSLVGGGAQPQPERSLGRRGSNVGLKDGLGRLFPSVRCPQMTARSIQTVTR